MSCIRNPSARTASQLNVVLEVMETSPQQQLDSMIRRGLVEFIFEAEQSLSLVEACGANTKALAAYNFGELFGTIQGFAINQFVLSITQIYEQPNRRYPNLGIQSVLKYVEEQADSLQIREPVLLNCGLKRLGITPDPLDRSESEREKNIRLVELLRGCIPNIQGTPALNALKALRNKKIAHPEDINLESIEKTTWEEAEELLVPMRGIIGIVGDAYLSTAYWDCDGDYLLSADGSRVGRAMRRLIKALEK